jgi:hypothetical protein
MVLRGRLRLHVTNVTVGANDTTVAIQNGGSGSMNLGGWTLLMGRISLWS